MYVGNFTSRPTYQTTTALGITRITNAIGNKPADELKEQPPKSTGLSVHLQPAKCLRVEPIAGKWKCLKKIGSGSFGEVYLATRIDTGVRVAVKVESLKARHPQLLHEAKILHVLQSQFGIPRIYHFGTHMDEYAVLVMELLGPTLEEVFIRWGNRNFANSTVAMIGAQMIERLEAVHREGFIHRDVKPDNFIVGLGEHNSRDPTTGAHIPYSDRKRLTGTARYVSVNAHIGVEPSRRDDMESAGYVLVYFCKGGILPWQGLKAVSKKEKYARIMEKKMTTLLESLTAGLPEELYSFLSYCRKLGFDNMPDYAYLKSLMSSIIASTTVAYVPRNSSLEDTKAVWAHTLAAHKAAAVDSRECETTDTWKQPISTSTQKQETERSQYADCMARFQAGLEKRHFGYNKSLFHSRLYGRNAAVVEQKGNDVFSKEVYGVSKKQKGIFCINCARRNTATSETLFN